MQNKILTYRPKIIEGNVLTLSDNKRDKIKRFLESPEMLDVLELANQSKPTVHMTGFDVQQCNDRLKEISGWELCEAAILNCLDVLNKKQLNPLEEDFDTKATEL